MILNPPSSSSSSTANDDAMLLELIMNARKLKNPRDHHHKHNHHHHNNHHSHDPRCARLWSVLNEHGKEAMSDPRIRRFADDYAEHLHGVLAHALHSYLTKEKIE